MLIQRTNTSQLRLEMSCRSNLSVKTNVGLIPKMAILSTVSLTKSQGSRN